MHQVCVSLLGLVSVRAEDGTDLTPKSSKAKAMFAVLCLSRDGTRPRKWLQNLLWSDRGEAQGAGSVRTCLAEVRRCLGDHKDILVVDRQVVRLDVSRMQIDVHEMSVETWHEALADQLDLVQGLSVRDPEFESWLEQTRALWRDDMSARAADAQPARVQGTPNGSSVLDSAPLEPDWRLAIAVLPLENRTSDPAFRFVCEGLSEDLIDRLQRVRWLPVIARSSSFSNASIAPIPTSDFVKGLGALYYIEGSVTQSGNTHTVRLQLVETEKGVAIWTDSFKLSPEVQEGLDWSMDEIIGAISRSVSFTYQGRVMSRPPQDFDYLGNVWRGRWHLGQFTAQDSMRAREYLETALSVDPNGPEALVQMAYWHLWRAWVQRDTGTEVYDFVSNIARRVATIDPDDGRVIAMIGTANFWRGRHSEAETLFESAIEMVPSLALAHQQLGTVRLYADRPEEAVEPMRLALKFSPRDHLEFAFQTELAAALFRVGEYEEAWSRATLGVTRKPRYWYGHLIRILAGKRLGDADKVNDAKASLFENKVHLTPEHLEWLPLGKSKFRQELASALE